ncbi:hypothetical protein [Pedobacter alpinus]|uniref:Chaperone of endosialidase n=1 Tax=Pedobacter alpinus TaxID=1590643 RepID=A0ABW5TU00_9SPHI
MKKSLLVIKACIVASLTVNAQTNTFPTSGNVGIGTTNPQAKLDVNGVIQTYNLDSQVATWDNMKLWSNGVSSFIYSDGDEEGMILKSITGNKILLMSKVGIGISDPNYSLTFANDKTISFNSDATNPFGIEGGDHSQTRIIMGQSSGASSNISFGVSNGNGYAGFTEKMRISASGNIGIGTTNPSYKLDVIGTIRSREVKVDMNGADFVFEKDYGLMPLSDLEQYIKTNKHLPEVASAKEMENNGVELGKLNTKLLQKIEELTLYTIAQEKKINALEEQNKKMKLLENRLAKLEILIKE